MIEIDGASGEGGGQILRTALSLSALLALPFRIVRIRAGRKRPGLGAQHLTCVHAAARICGGETEGDRIGSQDLTFRPGPVVAGDYEFDVEREAPSAGSVGLVLQCLLPPLLFAGGRSRVTLAGGTHTAWSPSADYLDCVFLPALARMGARVAVHLERPGFYPAGGGRIRAEIDPVPGLRPLRALERGAFRGVSGVSVAANLPVEVARRQADRAAQRLAEHGIPAAIEAVRAEARCPGTSLLLAAAFERADAGFDALGARGKPAERVGDEAAEALLSWLGRPGALDPYLLDQMVLPMALAAGGSEATAAALTPHARTNLQIVGKFLGAEIEVSDPPGGPCRVAFRGAGYSKNRS